MPSQRKVLHAGGVNLCHVAQEEESMKRSTKTAYFDPGCARLLSRLDGVAQGQVH